MNTVLAVIAAVIVLRHVFIVLPHRRKQKASWDALSAEQQALVQYNNLHPKTFWWVSF